MLNDPTTLRLVWPEWQGAGRENVAELLPELPETAARHGYVTGSRVLEAILPAHDGPTEHVPVGMQEPEEGSDGGIESRRAILASQRAALAAIARHDPPRILTLGGECAVSVAPFSYLAARYGEDLAVVWIDAHPDADTPQTGYDGFHAMAVTALLGEGDAEVRDMLPGRVPAERIVYAGMHEGEPDALANVADWHLPVFGPEALRGSTAPLVEHLRGTGATRLAIHLDVDVVDSEEITFGLGQVPGGLTSSQVHRIIADLGESFDVVGLSIAEYIPRQAMALAGMLEGLPLIGGSRPETAQG